MHADGVITCILFHHFKTNKISKKANQSIQLSERELSWLGSQVSDIQTGLNKMIMFASFNFDSLTFQSVSNWTKTASYCRACELVLLLKATTISRLIRFAYNLTYFFCARINALCIEMKRSIRSNALGENGQTYFDFFSL